MSSKAGKNPKAIKSEPVYGWPELATDEEREQHLRYFIEHFIQPGRRSRWCHFLLDKPAKARDHLHRFEHDLDARYCVELRGATSFPQTLREVYGSEPGLYFDEEGEVCKMTAAEAATMAAQDFRDALLSFGPGRGALFFHHDGTAWWCERPQPGSGAIYNARPPGPKASTRSGTGR